MPHKITTIISYCTHDYKWLKPCVDHVSEFSKEVIVPICDHFFNGDKENDLLINNSIQENPNVKFIEFAYCPELYENPKLQRLNDPFAPIKYMMDIDPKEIWFWNQMARLIGFNQVADDIEYVLFLDADEIVDTIKFTEWLDKFPYQTFNAMRFDSYFYFRDIKFRAIQTEDWNGITLVKKDALNEEAFFKHSSERLNFINFVEGNRQVKVLGLDGQPMFHHYSWVRTKEEMLRKVNSWSHHKDRDWTSQVNQEFEREFNPNTDKCFVHDYNYIEVEPYIKL
jgi:hypothetical protein